MGFGLHYHYRFLKDPVAATVLQLVLFTTSFIVLFLEVQEEETAPAPAVKVPKPKLGKKSTKKVD